MKSILNKLLKIAVSNGVEAAIKLQIAKGDDLDARDDAGNTPLMIAACCWRMAPTLSYWT